MPQYVLSISYGKDSLACLGAIEKLGLPLDRIVTAEVWFDENIPADLPPMREFKAKAERIIKDRWGIKVEHFTCNKYLYLEKDKVSYKDAFYQKKLKGKHIGEIYGFPIRKGNWCLKLKLQAIDQCTFDDCVQYLGIAEDEPERLARLDGVKKISPLHLIGWTESDAKKWCIENDLLSPIYTDTCTRGGVGFVIIKEYRNFEI